MSERRSSKTIRTIEVSAPSLIFRNLLIIESDLREQYNEQIRLKRNFSIFLIIIVISICEFFYLSYNYPNKFLYKFILIILLITIILFKISGEYKRTITNPRRFLNNSNKGLRQFNVRLIKIPGVNIIIKNVNKINFLIIKVLILIGINKKRFEKFYIQSMDNNNEVCNVKIVMNPRSFSAEIREGWEIYRDEFWARENIRRRTRELSKFNNKNSSNNINE